MTLYPENHTHKSSSADILKPLYPPIGETMLWDGTTRNLPKNLNDYLDVFCEMTKATPLAILDYETDKKLIKYVIQKESHLAIIIDKQTGEASIDDATCGENADPKKVSPIRSGLVRKVMNVEKGKETEHILSRGRNHLLGTRTRGDYIACDIYGCDSKRLNDERYIKAMLSRMGNLQNDPKATINTIAYEFWDEETNKPDGYSAVAIVSTGDMIKIVSGHTYQKEGVLLFDINSTEPQDFSKVPQMLADSFEGKRYDAKVLRRKGYKYPSA